MIVKRIIAIGGGELKSKTTLAIDGYIAELAKKHAAGSRAYGLFVGTASHDSMPYFNSFRKTYTSEFGVKADCALTVYGEMTYEKIAEKFKKADFIYIGGGDTLFMLQRWRETGLDKLILDAYERGVLICGLSAGAIFWFDTMYTDSDSTSGDAYSLHEGLGILHGVCTPHYDERQTDFDEKFLEGGFTQAYAISNNSAIEFTNGVVTGAVSSGGQAYILKNDGGRVERFRVSSVHKNF